MQPLTNTRSAAITMLIVLSMMFVSGKASGEAEPPPEPAAPEATLGVRNLLHEVDALVERGDQEAALEKAGATVDDAVSAGDVAGQALGWKARAQILESQNRPEEARVAWSQVRGAWRRAGDGPGEVEAIGAEARLALRQGGPGATRLLDEALGLAEAEKRRPIAAAEALGSAGRSLLRAGYVEEAGRLCRSALDRLESVAPGSLALATSLNNLGVVAEVQGDRVAARDHHTRALTIREEHAPGSLDVAESLNKLGNVEGDLVAARDLYKRALALRKEHAPGSLDVAASLSNLGIVASQQGDLVAARDLFTRALAIQEEQAPGSLAVARTLGNFGNVVGAQGDLVAARDLYKLALAIWEEQAPESLAVATNLSNLGNVAGAQGDLVAARDRHTRALKIFKKIFKQQAPGSLAVAASLNNLGNVAEEQGDLVAAREFYTRGLTIEEEQAPGSLAMAASLNNLGSVVLQQGDPEAAREFHTRALAIQEERAPGSLAVAGSLSNLGDVASQQRDLVAAREFYTRALAIREEQAPGSLDVAASLHDLGVVAKSRDELGVVARSRNDRADARDFFARSWGITKRHAAAITGDQARQSFGEVYGDFAFDLLRSQLDLEQLAAAFGTLEESRSQALLQMLALRGIQDRLADPSLWTAYVEADLRHQGAAKRLAEASASLDRARSDLELSQAARTDERDPQQAAIAMAESDLEAARSEYTRFRLEKESRLIEVRNAIPALRDDSVPLEEAREALPPNALWVAFAVGQEDTAVFLVPAASPDAEITAYVVPLGAEELAAKVAAVVDSVRSRPPVAKPAYRRAETGLIAASRELFALLFPTTVRPLLERSERLMISPDGVLWELPFGALVTNVEEKRATWLGLEKPVSHHHSLSAYVRDNELRQGSGDGVLIVGNPTFGATETAAVRGGEGSKNKKNKKGKKAKSESGQEVTVNTVDWHRGEQSYFVMDGRPPAALPGAEDEAREVAELYAVQPLIGPNATEPAVRARLPHAGVVHLATHGYFHPTIPMASGVLLAAPTEEPAIGQTRDDGILQAYELSGDLQLAADLVVLSACETGRGQVVRGEGIVGLTRSLQMAGARSVVATHWRIHDRASGAPMASFHRKLLEGVAKDEALRQAMVETSKRASTRHPHYWAAFFLTGEPGVAENRRPLLAGRPGTATVRFRPPAPR